MHGQMYVLHVLARDLHGYVANLGLTVSVEQGIQGVLHLRLARGC